MKNNHTLIIGSGIVGATLALKLAQAKMPATLIDARPARDDSEWQQVLGKRDARVYALSLASINLLKDVGAWQKIAASERKADYPREPWIYWTYAEQGSGGFDGGLVEHIGCSAALQGSQGLRAGDAVGHQRRGGGGLKFAHGFFCGCAKPAIGFDVGTGGVEQALEGFYFGAF